MASYYDNLDHTFANLFVTLRTTLGMTQAALAEKLSVTDRAIQRWEGGTRYPKAEYLKAFLALCLEQHAFTAGHEVEQARTLWKAAHLKVLFDEQWVLTLLSAQAPQPSFEGSDIVRMPQSIARQRIDWGEEVSEVSFYGRENEQAQLTTWIQEERCRLIALLGMGGIGKSALALRLMHQLAPSFSVAVFRSVRDAIPCEELVVDLIQSVAPEPIADIPENVERRITLLLELLQTRRCLLVLDNMETLLQEGEQSGQYRVGYEDYRQLLERIGTTQHQSCILLTSREKPSELKPLEGSRTPVRSLHLTGLDENAGEQILAEKQLRGDAEARRHLIEAYSGNPLALKIVAETIRELFESDIAAFLAEGQLIFQGVRALLAQQFARLAFLEQSVLRWLAIVREPTNVTRLLSLLVTSVPRLQLLEALENLRRRSLVEHGQQRSEFTLQSVVMEFVADELVKQIATEIQRRQPDALLTYGLSLASAKEYIRQTQERLLLAPALLHLGANQHRKGVVEQQLHHCLDLLRSRNLNEQGYGPTNITMLLHRLKGSLQGIDLSNCMIREASLQGVQMQDASLQGSSVQTSTFTEASGIIAGFAVTKDGTAWAVGNDVGQVRIFAAQSGIPFLVLQAHSSISAITFSPDGTRLAIGGRDNLIKIWQLENATLSATMQGHSRFISKLAFSPNGTQLATCSMDGTVRIWDLASLQTIHVLHSHENGVACVAWSSDGRLLASGGENGIRLWNPQSGSESHMLRDEGNDISGLAFSPDDRFLVSGGTDQLVKVWDVASGNCLERLQGHLMGIGDVAWSPDGRSLASGSYDATVRLWYAHPARTQHILLGHRNIVQTVAFNTDGTTLFSGSVDCSVRLWETANGYCARLIQGYEIFCHCVAWHPRGDIVATATNEKFITLWNPTSERPLRILRGHTDGVNSVIWNPEGSILASGSSDKTVRLWNANTGECLSILPSREAHVRTISWSPNGNLLAYGGYSDTIVRVWNIEKQCYLWAGEGHQDTIQAVAWSPDGTYLASGGTDSTVRLWSAEDGTLLKTFKANQEFVYDMAWSPDSTQLAICCGVEISLWDITSEIHSNIVLDPICLLRTVAWHPQRNMLLAGSRDGTVCWLETKSWTSLFVRKEHQGNIRSLRITPDGHSAASADSNGVIIIWDIEQAIPLHTLHPERPYERLDISGIQGITDAQKAILRDLGAVER